MLISKRDGSVWTLENNWNIRQTICININNFTRKGIFMKVINIRKKTIFKISGAILFVMIIGIFTNSFSMQHYYNVGFSTGLVTATTLNIRSGPGTNYPIVATVKKNEYIRVFAGIGDWYVVQVEGDYIGAVSKKYIKAIYPNSSGSGTGSSGSTTGRI